MGYSPRPWCPQYCNVLHIFLIGILCNEGVRRGLESRAVHDCGRRRRRRSRRRWRRSRRRRQQQSATAPSRATDLAHLQPAWPHPPKNAASPSGEKITCLEFSHFCTPHFAHVHPTSPFLLLANCRWDGEQYLHRIHQAQPIDSGKREHLIHTFVSSDRISLRYDAPV